MSAVRRRLPNRRPSESMGFTFGEPGHEIEYRLTIGRDPVDGSFREFFLNGGLPGSDLDLFLSDTAVVVSLALQHDIPLIALRLSMAQAGGFGADSARRASAIGYALDLAAELECASLPTPSHGPRR